MFENTRKRRLVTAAALVAGSVLMSASGFGALATSAPQSTKKPAPQSTLLEPLRMALVGIIAERRGAALMPIED